jgi:hypothetical protein
VTIDVGPIICPVCGQEGYITFIRVQHGPGRKNWHYISEVDLCYAMALSHPDLLVEAIAKALNTLRNIDPEKAKALADALYKIIEAYKKE